MKTTNLFIHWLIALNILLDPENECHQRLNVLPIWLSDMSQISSVLCLKCSSNIVTVDGVGKSIDNDVSLHVSRQSWWEEVRCLELHCAHYGVLYSDRSMLMWTVFLSRYNRTKNQKRCSVSRFLFLSVMWEYRL